MPPMAVPYVEAREVAETGKPILAVFGSQNCPGCITAKDSTIPQIAKEGDLKDVSYVYFDVDEDQLPAGMFQGNTIPQVVMCQKRGDKWVYSRLTGSEVSKARLVNLLRFFRRR